MVLGKCMSKAMPLLCVSRSFSPIQWILTCHKSRICKDLHITIIVDLPNHAVLSFWCIKCGSVQRKWHSALEIV